MTSPKKSSVKWDIPSPEQDEDSITDRYVYSDTFIDDKSTIQNYSDTFISETHSDTFFNETSQSFTSRERGRGKDDSETENIRTLISFKNSFDESEIQDATYLETAQTGVLETVMEVDSDLTSTAITETFKTSYDEASSYDYSGTHPRDSYTDTFESSERTKVDSQYDETSDHSSQRSTETNSYHSKTYSGDSYEDGSLLDRSYIAPDYDGKALTDDEETDTFSDDYSYTFEPTDTMSYVIQDTEKTRHEAQQINLGEQTKRDFVKSLVQKLRSKPDKQFKKLETLPFEASNVEEDDYVRHFCKKKVKMVKKRKHVKKETKSEPDSEMTEIRSVGQYSGELLSDYGLPDSLLERAKITNIMSAMKRAAQEEIHEPKKCPECRELKSRLDVEDAERKFVTAHARRLKNKMMDARVEEHMLRMNSISMIAELARELPRHSEKPEKIFDRLFEPLLGKNVMR